MTAREAALLDQQNALEREKASVDRQVIEKTKVERARIAGEEVAKARRMAEADLEQKANKLAELRVVLRQRDVKLAEAQKVQTDLIRQQRDLEDARREIDLTVKKRVEPFVVYAADAADDGPIRLLRQLLRAEPRTLHHVPNTLTVLTLAAAGIGLAPAPASLETVNIPNVAYRPLADFSPRCDLILVSRRNEPSPVVRQFVERARTAGGAQDREAARKPRRRKPRRR